jgi:hypothetical protein
MRPFPHGFAGAEARRIAPLGPALGLLPTRDAAALPAEAGPPAEDRRDRTFAPGPARTA